MAALDIINKLESMDVDSLAKLNAKSLNEIALELGIDISTEKAKEREDKWNKIQFINNILTKLATDHLI